METLQVFAFGMAVSHVVLCVAIWKIGARFDAAMKSVNGLERAGVVVQMDKTSDYQPEAHGLTTRQKRDLLEKKAREKASGRRNLGS